MLGRHPAPEACRWCMLVVVVEVVVMIVVAVAVDPARVHGRKLPVAACLTAFSLFFPPHPHRPWSKPLMVYDGVAPTSNPPRSSGDTNFAGVINAVRVVSRSISPQMSVNSISPAHPHADERAKSTKIPTRKLSPLLFMNRTGAWWVCGAGAGRARPATRARPPSLGRHHPGAADNTSTRRARQIGRSVPAQ